MNLFTDVLAGGCFHGISNVIKLKSRWKKIQKKNSILPACSVSFVWAPCLRNPEGVNSYLKAKVKNLQKKKKTKYFLKCLWHFGN